METQLLRNMLVVDYSANSPRNVFSELLPLVARIGILSIPLRRGGNLQIGFR